MNSVQRDEAVRLLRAFQLRNDIVQSFPVDAPASARATGKALIDDASDCGKSAVAAFKVCGKPMPTVDAALQALGLVKLSDPCGTDLRLQLAALGLLVTQSE